MCSTYFLFIVLPSRQENLQSIFSLTFNYIFRKREFSQSIMEMNPIMTSTLSNSSTIPITTTTVVYNNHLFLQTAACQAIAGAFTWAAILITGYHVRNSCYFSGEIFIECLFRFIFIYVIIQFLKNRNGLFGYYLSFLFMHSFRG